jgi:hypothetical protein
VKLNVAKYLGIGGCVLLLSAKAVIGHRDVVQELLSATPFPDAAA